MMNVVSYRSEQVQEEFGFPVDNVSMYINDKVIRRLWQVLTYLYLPTARTLTHW
jgi:hypothetical protein